MMSTIFRRVLPWLIVLTGCAAPGTAPSRATDSDSALVTRTLVHQGVERSYHIRYPRAYQPGGRYPMVLALHGGGGLGVNFDQIMTNGTFSAAADERSVVLVFPEGVRRQWLDGRSEIVKGDPRRDDVGFLSRVIDTMIANDAIDRQRVYATGISNGGFMSLRLAFDLADKVAAVAPVTAQVTKFLEDRTPARSMPLMLVNGTDDPLVPFKGGDIKLFKFGRSRGEILSTTDSVELFARLNGCAMKPLLKTLPDRDPKDRTTVQTMTFSQCRDNATVKLVKVIGGGHTWPGGTQYLRTRRVGVVSREFNGSEVILDFLLSHRLR